MVKKLSKKQARNKQPVKIKRFIRLCSGKRHAWVVGITDSGEEIKLRKPISEVPKELLSIK